MRTRYHLNRSSFLALILRVPVTRTPYLLLLVMLLKLPGYTEITVFDEPLSQSENGNFHVWVFNYNYQINPVDIKITIDDKVAVPRYFRAGVMWEWTPFRFQVGPGEHMFKILSNKASIADVRTFLIHQTPHCVVDFLDYPTADGKNQCRVWFFRSSARFPVRCSLSRGSRQSLIAET